MTEPQRLTHAQSARTILARCRQGALSTLATKPEGAPYGSLVSYALTPGGDPILLLSDLAGHTHNIKRDPRASLLVTDSLRGGDPLADGRVSVLGLTRPVDDEDLEGARAAMLEAHPSAQVYIGFKDFNLYHLHVSDVRYIGGFGRMSWLSLEDYTEARPDPLAQSAAGIIEHMNSDHNNALLLYARHQGQRPEAEGATLIAVDRLGMDIALQSPDRPQRIRIGFAEPATSANIARKALVQMAREAREALDIPHPD